MSVAVADRVHTHQARRVSATQSMSPSRPPGLLSDLLVNRLGATRLRVWLLLPVCLLALGSQALAAAPNVITTVHRLLAVSALTGLMYGTLFGLCPVIVFEWFGMKNFSTNWGIVSLSPVVRIGPFSFPFFLSSSLRS